MKTTNSVAEEKIKQLLGESFQGARVIQGGGNEITGNDLQDMILEAAKAALTRLYPKFHIGDQLGWDKVYKKAKEGAPDSLKMVGFDDEPGKHPVCKAVLGHIGAGKKGVDLRKYFADPEYGWDRDTIDGGIQTLLVAGTIRAHDDKGSIVDPREMDRKSIGKSLFKVESATVTTPQRIQIRKLLQSVGITANQGEELSVMGTFIDKITQLADSAGGEAPKPEPVDKSTIDEIRLANGNEQLLTVYGRRDELKAALTAWSETAKKIEQRLPAWSQLEQLLAHAGNIKAAEDARKQADAIKNKRLLLTDPDPVLPLVKSVENTLRAELTAKHAVYKQRLADEQEHLDSDTSWQQLDDSKKAGFLSQSDIEEADELNIGTQEELVVALQSYPVSSWDDRIEALSGRFDKVRESVAKYLEPKSQVISLPRRTLRTAEDVQGWIDEAKATLDKAINDGPVVLK